MAKSKFLTDIRQFMRLHGYSIRTENTYIFWIRFYIRFHQLRHPTELGAERGSLTIHDGKGNKDRTAILPVSLKPLCDEFIQKAISIQQKDNTEGIGPSMPGACL